MGEVVWCQLGGRHAQLRVCLIAAALKGKEACYMIKLLVISPTELGF